MPISRAEWSKLPTEREYYPTELTDIWVRKSGYMSWRRCPYSFDLHFIQDIEPDVEDVAVVAKVGISSHSWFAGFFDDVDYDALKRIRSYRSAYQLFKPMLPDHPILNSYCDNFIQFEASEWERISRSTSDPVKYWAPLWRELELEVPKVGFSHHIDRIDLLPSGSLIIIEYKPKVRPTSIREELSFYAIGVMASEMIEQPVSHVGCYGYATAEAKSWPIKPKMLHRVTKHVTDMRRDIKDHREGKPNMFPKKESMGCSWCWWNAACHPEEAEE